MGEIQRCRRLAVCGSAVRPWKTLTDEEKLNIEISENAVRKDFSQSEYFEAARRRLDIEKEKADERKKAGVKDLRLNSDEGRSDEIVARELGIGKSTLRQGVAIIDNKDLISAEDFADWDEGKLSTNKAFQKDTTPQKAPPEPGRRRGV